MQHSARPAVESARVAWPSEMTEPAEVPTHPTGRRPFPSAVAESVSYPTDPELSKPLGTGTSSGVAEMSSGSSMSSGGSDAAIVTVKEGAEEGEGGSKLRSCWASVWPPSRSTLIKLAVGVVLITVLLVAFLHLRIHEQFGVILEWIDQNKVAGAFAFAGLYAVCVVLFIPGAILSLGAGLVFGVWLGAAVVWVGATIGQTIAFPLGRFLFRDWIKKRTEKWQTWQAVELAIESEAWKIVFLLRLAPVVPYSALNYALGLTSVGFLPYTVTSAIGIIPGTLLYTYFGSLATDIASIINGEAGPDTTTTIITAVISGVVIIVVLVLVTVYAKRALKKKLAETEQAEAEEADPEAADPEAQITTETPEAAAAPLQQ